MKSKNGISIRRSQHSVVETINLLQAYLQHHGATVYARIDQSAEGAKVGITILPLQFILFGNPKSGVPLMLENPLVALDLPLKIIAWEDKRGRVWIGFNKSGYLKKRYNLILSAKVKLDIEDWVNEALGSKKYSDKAHQLSTTNTA